MITDFDKMLSGIDMELDINSDANRILDHLLNDTEKIKLSPFIYKSFQLFWTKKRKLK